MTDSISFKCPHCGVSLKMSASNAGLSKQARCPNCRQWIPLPQKSSHT